MGRCPQVGQIGVAADRGSISRSMHVRLEKHPPGGEVPEGALRIPAGGAPTPEIKPATLKPPVAVPSPVTIRQTSTSTAMTMSYDLRPGMLIGSSSHGRRTF